MFLATAIGMWNAAAICIPSGDASGGALPGHSSAWLVGIGVADTQRTHTSLDAGSPPGRVATHHIGRQRVTQGTTGRPKPHPGVRH